MLGKMFAAPLLAAAVLMAALVPSAASAEGGTPPAPAMATDASVACASPATSEALAAMCAVYTGGTLPEAAQAELAKTIVKLWKTLQQPAQVSTPAAACALEPTPHPAVPVLCTLWKMGALPADARESIGHIVVRLVNGKFELNRAAGARAHEAKAAGAKLANSVGAPTTKAAKPVDTTSYVEKCKALLAERPDDQSEKAQYCRKIVSGEVVPNAPKVTDAVGAQAKVKP